MKNADVKQLFIDSTEKQCAVLGGDYLMNYLSYGVLSKGFCVVSDKRVYFKGKCYYKNQNKYNSATEQRIVDLKDITGTGFFIVNPIWELIAAIVFLITMFCGFLAGYEGYGLGIFSSLMSITLFLIYSFSKQKMFEISFAGGCIAFKASNYSEEKLTNFKRI